uniref:Glutaredoxin domain-containing protein n=1 Tax=Bathycoccus sp. RCC716 virus 2 TaxID=2530039 RepID=A0A7S6P262_9PHYC|nr:hypothetical protein [Bathycoccus sp. RCC716 virus 2]|tara:strand:- start:652 stop:1068 length:417 start_codon:yes stop_codon:yes gene_type:complete
MSLLIYSPQCNHSLDIIDYISKNEQLKSIVSYHNINERGIPPQYKNKISRVPTMLTKNGKLLVGNEIKNWLSSLLPVKEVEMAGFGNCSMTTLDGEGNNELFGLDDYGMALQPAMTPELEEKINRSVSDAYNSTTKQT